MLILYCFDEIRGFCIKENTRNIFLKNNFLGERIEETSYVAYKFVSSSTSSLRNISGAFFAEACKFSNL